MLYEIKKLVFYKRNEAQVTEITIVTHSSSPSSSATFVTLTGHVITSFVLFTIAGTLLPTFFTVQTNLAFYMYVTSMHNLAQCIIINELRWIMKKIYDLQREQVKKRHIGLKLVSITNFLNHLTCLADMVLHLQTKLLNIIFLLKLNQFTFNLILICYSFNTFFF